MLTRQDIEALAKLAHLAVASQDRQKLQKDLEAILSYMDVLGSVTTQGLEPISQITGLTNVPRADSERQALALPQALIDASPAKQGRWIKVSKIIEKG